MLAALTGILAILPLLRESKMPSHPRFNGREALLLAANTGADDGVLFLPPLWQGLNLLLVQTTVVLLSVFALSGRGVGALLLIQYLIVVLATQQREGILHANARSHPAIWQAQWYRYFRPFCQLLISVPPLDPTATGARGQHQCHHYSPVADGFLRRVSPLDARGGDPLARQYGSAVP